jgi:maleate isomerase
MANTYHLPYEQDNGIGHRARIGVMVLPDDQNIEHELRMIFDLPGVACYVNRIPCAAAITADTLVAMEGEIARSAGLILPQISVDVMAFGCTSGSLLIGPATVHARIKAAHPDALCTTPIEAAAQALCALEARSIALITPYENDINLKLAAFLEETVCEVAILGSWNEPIDARVGHITSDTIRKAALEFGSSDSVDAVFISCTNLRALDLIGGLESNLGKPVISSNQALGWHCLRLAGISSTLPQFGRLFSL